MWALTGKTRIAFLLFFASHILITLLIDGQAFFSRSRFYPQPLQDVVDWYASTFKVREYCVCAADIVVVLFISADFTDEMIQT